MSRHFRFFSAAPALGGGSGLGGGCGGRLVNPFEAIHGELGEGGDGFGGEGFGVAGGEGPSLPDFVVVFPDDEEIGGAFIAVFADRGSPEGGVVGVNEVVGIEVVAEDGTLASGLFPWFAGEHLTELGYGAGQGRVFALVAVESLDDSGDSGFGALALVLSVMDTVPDTAADPDDGQGPDGERDAPHFFKDGRCVGRS